MSRLPTSSKDTNTMIYKPAIIGLYSPRETEQTVNFSDDQWEYEVTFYYDKADTSPSTLKVELDHVNDGAWQSLVGNHLITSVNVDASSIGDPVYDVTVYVYFDPTFLDLEELKVFDGVLIEDDIIKETVVDPSGVIKIHFKQLKGGDYYGIPIQWAYKPGPTPQSYKQELVTELRDADTKLLTYAKNEAGDISFPSIGAYYYEPICAKVHVMIRTRLSARAGANICK